MKKAVLSLVFCLGAVFSFGEETLVPIVAWGAAGAGGNRWSTELYLTNLTSTSMNVILVKDLPLRVKPSPHPCLRPTEPILVEPQRTRIVLASELGHFLGCPEEYVGGLVFSHPEGLVLQTRMTNTKHFVTEITDSPLRGFSQEIPGVSMAELAGGHGRYIVPALVWSPNPCPGEPVFDTYLYLANPGDGDATVTFFPREGETFHVGLPQEQELPFSVKVPGGKVVQRALRPVPPGEGGPCSSAEFFDLYFEADAPVAVLASVVDRASNDARTVLVTRRFQLLP